MQYAIILSNGLRTCKERLNARSELIPSLLSSRHHPAVTVFWTGEEAGHGRSTEGTEFSRGKILVSIATVGQLRRMARSRIVQVKNPKPRSSKS